MLSTPYKTSREMRVFPDQTFHLHSLSRCFFRGATPVRARFDCGATLVPARLECIMPLRSHLAGVQREPPTEFTIDSNGRELTNKRAQR